MSLVERTHKYIIRHRLLFAIIVILVILVCVIIFTLFPYKSSKKKVKFSDKIEYFSAPSPHSFINIESFESIRIGSNSYKVHEDLSDPHIAAQTMDQLNTNAHIMINLLNQKYINDPNGINIIYPLYRDRVSNGIKSLTKNFITANMEENIPERSGGDTSYVIDKGDVFAMCLRDPNNNNKVDTSNNMNELNFVLFHEMCHLFTSTFGHDILFWNNFRFILQEATIANLYNPTDYKKNSKPYCGIVITYSPLFDNDLVDYKLKSLTTQYI